MTRLGVEHAAVRDQSLRKLGVNKALGHGLAEAEATAGFRINKLASCGVYQTRPESLVKRKRLAGDWVNYTAAC